MCKRVLGVFEKSQKYDAGLTDTKSHSRELSFWQMEALSTLSALQKS